MGLSSAGFDFDIDSNLIVGNILGLVFLCLLWFGTRSLWYGYASRKWPVADGVITQCRLVDRPSADSGENLAEFNVAIRYVYSVGGREFAGRRLRFGQRLFWHPSPNRFIAMERRFPPGTVVPIRYNPRKPRMSVIEPGPSAGAWLAASVGWLVIGALLLFGHRVS
jgi:hypothetical protein